MFSLILTTTLIPIIVAVIVLLIEYWIIQPLRDRERSTVKGEISPFSFWRNLKLRYKFVALFSLLVIAGVFTYRVLQSNFKCESMTFANEEKCFQVYTDKLHFGNHFFPSGFMGDVGDVKLEETSEEVHSGATAIKVVYEQSGNGLGWAGIVWQFPSNNWGTFPEGFDLRGNRYVTFWAKSARPNQIVRFAVGGLGRKQGTCERDPGAQYPESFCPRVEVTCNLANQWFKFAIAIPEDRDLQHIIGGFSWTTSSSITFYLDDIFWVSNPALPPWEGPFICDPVS